MKLHIAVKHVVKHYSYWHAGRIRAASGIRSFDWLLLMTPLCLPSYVSAELEERMKHSDWAQAVDLADNFSIEEIKGMSGGKYAYELFKRTNNLLDMKHAQSVS
jgi:hypothetical protein